MKSAAIKTHSLSRQLIGGVLLAEMLCAALFSAAAIGTRCMAAASLRRHAAWLRRLAAGSGARRRRPEDNVAVDPTELVLPPQDVYEVLSPSGRVLGHSPGSSAALLAELGAPHAPGYFNFTFNREHYRALRFDGVRVIDREENGGVRRPVTVLYAGPPDSCGMRPSRRCNFTSSQALCCWLSPESRWSGSCAAVSRRCRSLPP